MTRLVPAAARVLGLGLTVLAIVPAGCGGGSSTSGGGGNAGGVGGGAGGGPAGGSGGGGGSVGGGGAGGGPATSGPLDAPAGAWTWIDIPGAVCDDGTQTGIAVNPAPSSGGGGASGGGDLLLFFNGGGACWDATTCLVLNSSTHGPFGRTQWEANVLPTISHSFDRARATNPFRAMSIVFVPYCTGDLHAGSNVVTYMDPFGTPHPFHHVGRTNLLAVLPRLQATWPAPARLIVSGSSAGGYGATFNYDLLRTSFPSTTVGALIDDAGPLLESSSIPPDERAAWVSSWHIDQVIDPLCPTCVTGDFSLYYPALVARYPSDRMALLSSLQDQTIRQYFMISMGSDYEAHLRALVTDRLVPTSTFRAFLIPGQMHTLLPTIDTTASGSVTLEAWLAQMLAGDPAWVTVGL